MLEQETSEQHPKLKAQDSKTAQALLGETEKL